MLRKFLSKAALACFLTGATLSSLVATAQVTKDAKLPVDSKVTIGKLPNGLTYYIRPNNKPEKKVELRLVVNAGSILESDDQQGLAHLMEHMNFNGTKNFPKNKLVDFLQSIGVEFGADLNANTGFDRTLYILPIPTDKPGNLENGFQIIEDWAHNANLLDADINDERNIVIEENRGHKGAGDRMMKKYLPKLVAGSKYANRLPGGKDEILSTFKPDLIRSFYRDWYRPNLMAVAVVGDITIPEAEAMIRKHFGGMKNPANARPRTEFEIKPYAEAGAMVLTDKEETNYQFQLFFPAKKKKETITLSDYRNDIVKSLFTQILNSRLQELTQSATPPFASAGIDAGNLLGNYDAFVLAATPTTDIPTTVNTAIGELVKARDFGFTASELEIAKKKTLSYVEKVYNERNATESAVLIDEYVDNFMENDPIPGIENEFKYYKEMLPGITLNEVNAEAKKWLNKEYNKNFFTLLTGPEGKQMKMPTDMELKEMVSNAFDQKLSANAEKVVAENLLDKQPTPGKIVSEATDKELGATTYTLSNGIKVTVKKTDFKSDEIVMTAVKKGGLSLYGVEDKSSAKFMPDVIEAMGYGQFTPTALTDALSGKTVGLVPEMGQISAQLRGNSSVKDFESLMQLTYLQMTEPRKDPALFNGFIGTQKMQLQYLSQNPQMAFIDTLVKTVYHGDPRRPIQIPTTQDVENINMDRSLEIYKNEFSNADGFHFFLAGNVDEQTLKPLLEKYIASLPTKGTTTNFKDDGLRPASGNNKLEFKKGQEQKSLVITMFSGEMPYTEDIALQTTMIGDILSIKALEQIREKMGAMYSGGFSGSFEKYPYGHYTIQGGFPCGPENVQPIIKAASDEIAAIKANGPTQADLDKARLTIIEKRREGIKTNNYWTGKLEQLLFWDNSKERFLNFENEINKITVADMKATANKLFDGKNSLTAVLLPEVIKPVEAKK
jgi:zinc protease